MPVNKDALKRYRIIDKILADPNHDYTTDDILNKVNRECESVSKRMIQKDIKSLEEEFGKVMVRNAGGRGTVKYKDQSEPLFYQELTWEEEEILREALKSLGQFEGLDNFTWLDLLKKKLEVSEDNSLLPCISFSKEWLKIPDTLLGKLFMAISRKTVIRVIYTPFGKPSIKIAVHPYQLKQFNDRWFLLCCPLETEEFPFNPEFILNLALDRMSDKLEYIEDVKYVEPVIDLKARFDEIIGVTYRQDVELEDIYFAVDDNSVDYVRTKCLHITQIELDKKSQEYFRTKYPSMKNKTFFCIECRENHELYARFASYMKNVTIVEPIAIRDKMMGYLEETILGYKNIIR